MSDHGPSITSPFRMRTEIKVFYHFSTTVMSAQTLPAKAKKKKRSAFEDDDFFVMKKKKGKSPKPPLIETPKIELQKPTDVLSSDDLHQSFHSAKEDFDDGPLEWPEDITNEIPDIVDMDSPKAEEEVDADSDLTNFFRKINEKQANSEDKRTYLVKIISKKSPTPQSFQVSAGGNTTFGSIIDQLGQQALIDKVPFYLYDGTLVWVEGKLELKPFFKPSTLRINPPADGAPTKLTCIYIPMDDLDHLESYPEFQEPEEVPDTSILDAIIVEERTENTEERKDFFVIGLKGKDNKRVEVEVGPDTKIRSLLNFYLSSKGLQEGKNPRLLFDDEELDLDGLVKDTELEEDFEVQVYM